MKILHEDCEVGVATDKTLPYDLVISGKQVDIFDHYYDKYKKNFKGFTQADGMANPNLWPPKGAATKKRKKKPRREVEE